MSQNNNGNSVTNLQSIVFLYPSYSKYYQ